MENKEFENTSSETNKLIIDFTKEYYPEYLN